MVFLIILPFASLLSVFAIPTNGRANPNTIAQNIVTYGFPAETHSVITTDGYVLEMQRIPYGRNQTPSNGRPIVFLMHGLLDASSAFLFLGPELAPSYNLADAGFDVWMGNARGNGVSRSHICLDPDDAEDKLKFFDFSWEEIAIYDLPAMIDYILKHTEQDKLHYIGHSQGGTVFLVLNSMRPEYNEKIASAHLFAGVGYQKYFPNVGLRMLAALTDIIYRLAILSNIVELNPLNFGKYMIQQENRCDGIDRNYYRCQLRSTIQLLRHDTESQEGIGASAKQVAHYGQNVRDRSFRRWSYNRRRNLENYGSADPPAYNLSLITINVTMHYTTNDHLLDEIDVIAMANDMPNAAVRKVARDDFSHGDFVTALDAKELVTDYVIEALKTASKDFIEVEAITELPLSGSTNKLGLGSIVNVYIYVIVCLILN